MSISSTSSLYMYRISSNFCDDLIFAFFAISFKLQTFKYVEIIFCIIFYIKKLFKLQKMTGAN